MDINATTPYRGLDISLTGKSNKIIVANTDIAPIADSNTKDFLVDFFISQL